MQQLRHPRCGVTVFLVPTMAEIRFQDSVIRKCQCRQVKEVQLGLVSESRTLCFTWSCRRLVGLGFVTMGSVLASRPIEAQFCGFTCGLGLREDGRPLLTLCLRLERLLSSLVSRSILRTERSC
ncbi:hypothetical protein chiPu_0022109 [Chiloscyllium punctatum]|uniref:Uncharacterized protein n=1 Tax=Chiloscyllium punctatum TaxID=137246 RepID=A0A401RKB2_CHIPU|nr:hypothetical protein [Chiloscyllium punctatum]